ncbi:hypothetical protein [Weissella paramesenteroides]|uniref:Uncharacterized protein n=1 Tax=Weissella paramesenteroides ATCC 33313 TaxID=585506 RepID=C5RCW4_WEIPA|nr:hypothetical protein [Weissella paramesenteroides]ATF41577.1 hypothetical protein CO680_05680 [Weissella paramesenteroides]EER74033.1 hypothetical protein HMPREF0877_1831 [Weissella paramesenteroides ATCC 33313]
MKYQSLNSVVKQIDEKRAKNALVKSRLHKAINNLQKLDEITWLLDYNLKLPEKNWYPKVQVLYEILAYSLGLKVRNVVNSERKSGRISIFNKNKQDIVSKFRVAGIQKFRTSVLLRATDPVDENERKNDIWDKAFSDWCESMHEWIDEQNDRLSSDESEISNEQYFLSSYNTEPSEFVLQVVSDLNNTDKFKSISYEEGNIDSIFKRVVVIDLFNRK